MTTPCIDITERERAVTNFFAYAQKLREALAHLGDDEDAPHHRNAVNALIGMAGTTNPSEILRHAIDLEQAANDAWTYWRDVMEGDDPTPADPESIAAREHADAEGLTAAGRGHLNVRGF